MPLPPAQKHDVEEVIQALLNTTRNKRKLAEMFMDLPDRTAWAEYYEVCIRASLSRRKVLTALLLPDYSSASLHQSYTEQLGKEQV